jgi:hypothetical protein
VAFGSVERFVRFQTVRPSVAPSSDEHTRPPLTFGSVHISQTFSSSSTCSKTFLYFLALPFCPLADLSFPNVVHVCPVGGTNCRGSYQDSIYQPTGSDHTTAARSQQLPHRCDIHPCPRPRSLRTEHRRRYISSDRPSCSTPALQRPSSSVWLAAMSLLQQTPWRATSSSTPWSGVDVVSLATSEARLLSSRHYQAFISRTKLRGSSRCCRDPRESAS